MTTQVYHKTKLIEIMKDVNWKLSDSPNAKATYFIRYITRYHLFEKMLDSEGYLYPRGYDLLMNVLIPGEKGGLTVKS